MKKFIATFVMMAMMAIMIPLSANAQTRNGRYYKAPNIYDRHRKSINIGAGGAGGALLGALIGGKKGAVIGALLGAGGGAIFTAKQKSRNYYKLYR
jgi:uncharacterized membrane protein